MIREIRGSYTNVVGLPLTEVIGCGRWEWSIKNA
jgi:predicted house-cleaning NTP pyrophosphatase (Maf/HAM1 superfamily)